MGIDGCTVAWGAVAEIGKAETGGKWRELSVNVAALADLDDVHDKRIIFDGVHDSVLSLSDTVAILVGEFFASARTGVFSQCPDS